MGRYKLKKSKNNEENKEKKIKIELKRMIRIITIDLEKRLFESFKPNFSLYDMEM